MGKIWSGVGFGGGNDVFVRKGWGRSGGFKRKKNGERNGGKKWGGEALLKNGVKRGGGAVVLSKVHQNRTGTLKGPK